jgi:predicted PurR-regulated permease PerM
VPRDAITGAALSSRTAPIGSRFKSMPMPSAPFWVALIGAIIAVVVVILSAHALFVFAIGVALAFFLVPVVDAFERRGLSRTWSSILVVVIVVLVTLAALLVGAVILIDQGKAFLESLPSLIADIQAGVESLALPAWLEEAFTDIATAVHDALALVDPAAILIGIAQGVLGMLGLLFSFMLLPFFTFYLLKDQPRMARNFYAQVPGPWMDDVRYALHVVTADFANYFKAELMVGTIMGITVAIGMFVIGTISGAPSLVEFAPLLGLIAFVMELLPQIGPIISYIPAALIAITSSPLAIVLVSVFYFVIFNIEGSILVPTFEGHMISFSGATVLVLITIGFALAGIVGAIVALPVASIIRDLFAHFFQKAQREGVVPPTGPPATEAASG